MLTRTESDLRRTISRVAAAALCCVTWMAACGGDDFTSSADGAGGSDGDGGNDATSTATSSGGAGGEKVSCEPDNDGACSQCLFAECEGIACACWAEPDCIGLFACYADRQICPNGADEACLDACLAEYKNGISAAMLASDCALNRCFGTCESAPPALDDCEVCLYSECSTEMNACLSQAGCRSLISCTRACDGEVGCANLCASEHVDWVDELDKIKGCAGDKCAACL